MKRILRSRVLLATGILFLSILSFSGLIADEWNKKTIITLTTPLEVPGAILQPGKYVMKLLDSTSSRNIVQIFNEDQNRVLTTFIAVSEQRPRATGDTEFIFYEEGRNAPLAMRSWFYPGSLTGLEFIYPGGRSQRIARAPDQPADATNRQLIAGQMVDNENKDTEIVLITRPGVSTVAMTTETITRDDRVTDDGTLSQNEAADNNVEKQIEPVTPPVEATPSVSEDTVDLGQKVDTPKTSPSSTSLPETASSLPLVGLLGVLSLGMASLLQRFHV